MIDENKVMIDSNGQMLSIEKFNKAIELQKKILILFNKTFDDNVDFQYINITLQFVHASKIKDFTTNNGLHPESARKVLIEHLFNTEAMLDTSNIKEVHVV